ncbi:MAG: CHAP domain-containing protein [Solirubrobacteraceae bacterium]|jgi:hypothetical protein
MSLEPVVARIAQIESAVADPTTLATATATATNDPVASTASASGSFANLLGTASEGNGSTVAEAEELDSTYVTEALNVLAGNGDDTTSSQALDPASGLLSLVGTGALGSSGSTTSSSVQAASDYPGVTAGGNQAIVQAAESQVGQTEQPPGSNNGPAITMYRTAVAGAESGEPWCAQFASWVAKQAGTPIGDQGQGSSSVSGIWSWAQQTGRAITNGPGVVPQPGDLIVFGDQHVGIVVGVQSNGDIDTVEGNYDNQVMRNVRSPDEATGYVNMSE